MDARTLTTPQQRLNQPLSAEQQQHKARKVAEEFESFFLYQVLDQMDKTVERDDLMGGGMGEDMYRQMFNEKAAEAITKQGGIGIADHIYDELIKLQESTK